jgi:hypothetical protein
MPLPRSLVALACLVPLALGGCPAVEAIPCFPAESSSVSDQGSADGGALLHPTLDWELDKLPSLADVPEGDPHAPPSEAFIRAQRDMKTEFWADAAKDLVAIVRGDTKDGRKLREIAEFDLAIALYRLKYYGEARKVFAFIASDHAHPMRQEAIDWLSRKICGS